MSDCRCDDFAKLGQMLAGLKGPHDDVAAERGVEMGMSMADMNRRSEFRLVFEAGYKAGFEAASASNKVEPYE